MSSQDWKVGALGKRKGGDILKRSHADVALSRWKRSRDVGCVTEIYGSKMSVIALTVTIDKIIELMLGRDVPKHRFGAARCSHS